MKTRWWILLFLVLAIAGFTLTRPSPTDSQLPMLASGEWRAMDNGQAQTPPMGWSSWNAFHLDIDQERLYRIADTLVSSGLRDAGYLYLNIDDGWWLKRRTADGRLLVNTGIFPGARLRSGENSFRPITDRLHGMGLKAGIYSDAGRNSCGAFWDRGHPNLPEGGVAEREVGTWDFTRQDLALFFDDWGFDYLKLDACGLTHFRPLHLLVRGLHGQFRAFPRLADDQVHDRYAQVGRLLAKPGRDVTYSVCIWGEANVNHWGSEVGNLWRTSSDITPDWQRMMANYESAVERELYAGPGRWNDPDMLAVGLGDFSTDHIEQARSHFSLWAMLSAPLILGNDLASMPDEILELVSNPDVIGLNQDPSGHQASRVFRSSQYDILVKTLTAPAGLNRKAMLVLNRQAEEVTVKVPLAYSQFTSAKRVKDVWTGITLASGQQHFELAVPAHGVRLLEIQGEHRLHEQRYLTEFPGQVHVVQSHSKTARILGAAEIGNMGIDGLEQALAIHPNSMLQWQVPAHARRLSGQFSAEQLDGDNRMVLGFYGDGRFLSRHSLSPKDTRPVVFSQDITSIGLLEITLESASGHEKTRGLLLNPIITYSHEP